MLKSSVVRENNCNGYVRELDMFRWLYVIVATKIHSHLDMVVSGCCGLSHGLGVRDGRSRTMAKTLSAIAGVSFNAIAYGVNYAVFEAVLKIFSVSIVIIIMIVSVIINTIIVIIVTIIIVIIVAIIIIIIIISFVALANHFCCKAKLMLSMELVVVPRIRQSLLATSRDA